MHKFIGQEESKQLKSRPDAEQAEAVAYKVGNQLAIPGTWVRGCLRSYMVETAPNKTKRTVKLSVSPRIKVEPFFIILTDGKGKPLENYEIIKAAIPAGNMSRGGCMDFTVNPVINEWCAEGVLVSSLDKPTNELKRLFENSGVETGIGTDRVDGYGRFKVISFEELK